MAERARDIYERLDTSLRDPNSGLAKLYQRLSPRVGKKYTDSLDKRLLDVTLGVSALLPAALITGAACAFKYLEDGANPLFIQDRLQNGKKSFKVLKIRTMVSDAERLPFVPETREADDKRVTWLGRQLRKHHIDEAPQLFQVLEGTLSAVGPRPRTYLTLSHFKSHWSEARYARSLKSYREVKKGVTGLNQVFGNGRRENGSRYHLEQFYAQKASLGFDLYILWKTIGRVLRG